MPNFEPALYSFFCSSITLLYFLCRWAHWARGLRRGSVASRLLELRVRVPPGSWMSLVSGVCCRVDISESGWSLSQRSRTEYGVYECDREALIMRRPWPTRGCGVIWKEEILIPLLTTSYLLHVDLNLSMWQYRVPVLSTAPPSIPVLWYLV
jgi:hypothetical protein